MTFALLIEPNLGLRSLSRSRWPSERVGVVEHVGAREAVGVGGL
jgi:hypothetical protein